MRALRKSLRRNVACEAVRLAWLTARCLPVPVVRALCRGFAHVHQAIRSPLWRIAVASVATALPDVPPDRRIKIATDCFRHWGDVLASLITDGRTSRSRIAEWGEWEPGPCHVAAAVRANAGAILVVPHFGEFIRAAAWLSGQFNVAVVTKRTRFPRLQSITDRIYADYGVSTLYHNDSLTRAIAHLRSGGVLVLAPDLDLPRMRGTGIPFFGTDAYTATGPATLAYMTGAALIPICFQTADSPTAAFTARVAEPVRLAAGYAALTQDQKRDAVGDATARISSQFESWIRETPHQWAWIHDRWKTPCASASAPAFTTAFAMGDSVRLPMPGASAS
jgi:KDO2-lipid IV(A) lauroyltransferase